MLLNFYGPVQSSPLLFKERVYHKIELSHKKNNNSEAPTRPIPSQKRGRSLKFWIRVEEYCTIRVAKTKALISCAVWFRIGRLLEAQLGI